MKRWSSLRRTEAPIPVALMALPSGNSLSGTARRCPDVPSLIIRRLEPSGPRAWPWRRRRMQLRPRRPQPLDGQHSGAFELQRQHGARLGRLAVDVDDAGAALRGVAADMGAGEPQGFAQ